MSLTLHVRNVGLIGTPVRVPFAYKHPPHGCNPPVRVRSCGRAVYLNKRLFRWPEEKGNVVISVLVVGFPAENGRELGAGLDAAVGRALLFV